MAKQVPPRSHGKAVARAERSFAIRQVLLPVQSYIHTESTGALVLLAASAAALIWANSAWSESYVHFWGSYITLDLGVVRISEDLRHWVNDALMALFFFVAGLEIKREIVEGGELYGLKQATLPVVAALGGMLVPAVTFAVLNLSGPGAHGWGIPMATDIAFALGVLGLLGKRVPSQLKVLLLALAIVDDIGAILVIAVFYTEAVAPDWLAIAAIILGSMLLARQLGVFTIVFYLVLGLAFWLAVFESGVHATIAGVILGLVTPMKRRYGFESFAASADRLLDRFKKAIAQDRPEEAEALLGQFEDLVEGTEETVERIERQLHPWASYLVLPLFALANAGIVLSPEMAQRAATSPVTWGIILGLVLGKPAGITCFVWLAVRSGLCSLPPGVRWSHLVGAGTLAGIGFTVSLFIAGLAYDDARLSDEAKVGILLASLVAGLIGFGLLRAGRMTNDE